MTVHVDLQTGSGGADPADGCPAVTFDDAQLGDRGGVYCFHVGAGGELFILVDENGESRVHRVYGPTAWHSVEGDVWRKGLLLQG